MVQESTSFILSSDETTIELSPLDNSVTTFACIAWTVFFRHDISGEKLKNALEKIAVAYPVVCGRLKAHPERRLEIAVSPNAGFSYTEASSDKTLKEAIAEARVTEQSAAFPSFAQLPFFAAQMNTMMTIDQDAPLLIVKLLHYADGGCSFAATVHHTVADAQRLCDLMVDISAAYRGEDLRTIDHDRARAWPDQLVEKVPVGLDAKDFPRVVKTPYEDLGLPSYPDETYAIESVYFPLDEVIATKKKVTAELKDVEFVSQVDVVTSLLWMVRCELAAMREGRSEPVKTAGDLNIYNSFSLYFLDLISKDPSALIPENFFGNAYIGTLAYLPEAPSDEAKEKNLLETLVEVATCLRQHVLMMQQPKAQVMRIVEVYKAMIQPPPFYPSTIAGISSFYKMPFDKIDFGEGPPILNYGLPAFPFGEIFGGICPMHNGKGIIINYVVRSRDRQATLESAVLKEFVPGFIMLSEKKPDEIAELIGLSD